MTTLIQSIFRINVVRQRMEHHQESQGSSTIQRGRTTKVLDSPLDEVCFDRYTSLTARLFRVPIALVSLVDIDRQWFKSRVGLSTTETHRDNSFSAYAILDDSPDVYVVLDVQADERFKNNPLVTGPPYVRFYAGAALIIDNIKVGTLSIFDTATRKDFSLADKMNLLDISSSVAQILSDRRAANLNQENLRSNMLLGLSHNLRTPLMCLTMGIQSLQLSIEKAVVQNPEISKTFTNNHFIPVNRAVGQLNFLVESSLTMTELMLQSNEAVSEGDKQSLAQLLQKAISISSLLNIDCKIKDCSNNNNNNSRRNSNTNLSSCNLPHLNAFFFVLVNSLSLLVPDAESVDIVTMISNDHNNHDEDSNNTINNCNFEVQLHVKGEISNESELRTDLEADVEEKTNGDGHGHGHDEQQQQQQQPWKLFSVKNTLRDIGEILDRRQSSIVDDDVNVLSPRSDQIRVLIVEDSIPIQKVMKNFLKGKGCEVCIASNGKEGLDMMKQQQSDFDVVFMDFLMPVMDGLTATKMWSEHIKTLRVLDEYDGSDDFERKSRTLLIGMSATATPPDLSQAFEYGMTCYCPKPIHLSTLTSLIEIMKSTKYISKLRQQIIKLSLDSDFIIYSPVEIADVSKSSSWIFPKRNSKVSDLNSLL